MSKESVIVNAFNINPSCLKVRLTVNSSSRGAVRLSLKVGKNFGIIQIQSRASFYRMEFKHIIHWKFHTFERLRDLSRFDIDQRR